ncbi:hypothetical protein DFH09DRAFT_1367520 [Mycena vulgaris]|nr:hypothetical protein DFH09DRAFT_1367520 [Mycena vulgaris]
MDRGHRAMSAPRLPMELERYIFELVAHFHPEMTPSLLRVAHRVHLWIEPLLYTVLALTTPARTEALLEAVAAKPAPFLDAAVRRVLVHWDDSLPALARIDALLAMCS